jgi:hypothetical protein
MMTEQVSIPEELRIQLRVPLIASSKEFQELWSIQKYLDRMKTRQLHTPEIQKYCDADVKRKIFLSDNEYLGIVIYASLKAVVSYLNERYIKFRISAYLSKDAYVPNWEGITISINLPFRNFHERMRVWREIEDRITNIVTQFKESKRMDLRKIDEANETIATTLDSLN